jgi:hypothetical protein
MKVFVPPQSKERRKTNAFIPELLKEGRKLNVSLKTNEGRKEIELICSSTTLFVKWTSFYVLYSGGHKCNSLWPVGLSSSRYADIA